MYHKSQEMSILVLLPNNACRGPGAGQSGWTRCERRLKRIKQEKLEILLIAQLVETHMSLLRTWGQNSHEKPQRFRLHEGQRHRIIAETLIPTAGACRVDYVSNRSSRVLGSSKHHTWSSGQEPLRHVVCDTLGSETFSCHTSPSIPP